MLIDRYAKITEYLKGFMKHTVQFTTFIKLLVKLHHVVL